MNEYWCNQHQFVEEYEDVVTLNEDILERNHYATRKNLDNYPTYKMTDEATGEVLEYCGASKNFAKVDPLIEDRRNFHFAGEDRVYLLVKNKFTKAWEFPSGKIYFGQTFTRAKQNLFYSLAAGEWRIKYFGMAPGVHTIRDLTLAEKEDNKNVDMKGVRTYFF
mmetsp:Transcript_17895/g.17108  ORF Transcript_17895/g.17108 Transcript_17895/m.17108 type:complete len:164 (+) Transcript_17895:390-881(+)